MPSSLEGMLEFQRFSVARIILMTVKASIGFLGIVLVLGSCSLFESTPEPDARGSKAKQVETVESPSKPTLERKREMVRSYVKENPSEIISTDKERELLAKIRQALMASSELSFKAKNVRIIVDKNEIQLVGSVDSKEEVNKAIKLTRGVAGERPVKNSLVIYDGWF
ncbi:MAG: BON domain-containing protein [Bdellovibrionales bacterium]|nr:BON domain-containing protein [Bdellovibrionales bacterium]